MTLSVYIFCLLLDVSYCGRAWRNCNGKVQTGRKLEGKFQRELTEPSRGSLYIGQETPGLCTLLFL